jgi:hypothetical protein
MKNCLIILVLCFASSVKTSAQKNWIDTLVRLVEKNFNYPENKLQANESCMVLLQFKKSAGKLDSVIILNEVPHEFKKSSLEGFFKIKSRISSRIKNNTLLPVSYAVFDSNQPIDNPLLSYNPSSLNSFIKACKANKSNEIMDVITILRINRPIIRD